MSATTGGSRRPLWKLLWRKLFKEKIRKTMLEYSNSLHLKGVPKYDEYTYSQNFDEGLVWDEIDGLSRSFSVRFADPTIIFFKKGDMSRGGVQRADLGRPSGTHHLQKL
ncbi:hypothetical protein C3L33_05290, partial [Rhododendron williamsianum]